MVTIYLLCGFIGSGKTTFAKRLEHEQKAVRFTMDEWMIDLFGEHMSRADFDRRLASLESHFKQLAVTILSHDVPVIFDFGFWRQDHRRTIREWALSTGARVEMVYFLTSPGICRKRTLERTEQGVESCFRIDGEIFDTLFKLFQPPATDEHFDRIIGELRDIED